MSNDTQTALTFQQILSLETRKVLKAFDTITIEADGCTSRVAVSSQFLPVKRQN